MFEFKKLTLQQQIGFVTTIVVSLLLQLANWLAAGVGFTLSWKIFITAVILAATGTVIVAVISSHF